MSDHTAENDPNHPEGWDCDGYPLSSGERCGGSEHRPFVAPSTPPGGES